MRRDFCMSVEIMVILRSHGLTLIYYIEAAAAAAAEEYSLMEKQDGKSVLTRRVVSNPEWPWDW